MPPLRAERPWQPRRVHFNPRPGLNNQHGEQTVRYKHEFPAFDYDNPRLWVVRCERFFMLARILRDEVMHVLCVNLSGKVAMWYETYLNSLREGFQWEVFARAICKRFCDTHAYVMEEFSNFKQWGSVVEFSDKYEEFKGLLLQSYPTLTDQYFLDSFVVRLKQQLRCFVRTSRPANLEEAMWLAKQFEKGLRVSETSRNNPTSTPKSSYNNPRAPFQNQRTQTNPRTYFPKQNDPNRNQPYQLPAKTTTSNSFQSNARSPEVTKLRDQLREQNRCYRCFDPWSPGHNCKSPTFNILEGMENQEGEEVSMGDQIDEEETEDIHEEEAVEVTLNAVIGGEGMNTIKLLGLIGKQVVIILVDSGSTHSFVDPKVLDQKGIVAEKTENLKVTVANGESMGCDSVCKGLEWQVQKEQFKKDLRVLKLGGCDIVLGMDWIDTYAPIQLHTRPPGISFHKDGKRVMLKGLTKKIVLQQASKKEIRRWKKEGVQGYLLQGMMQAIHSSKDAESPSSELTVILQEYQEIFDEPKGLPPSRSLDHEIPLIPGSKPVHSKPYRYSYLQKNAIEKIVDEMLTAAIISPSSHPFASPVLLVPKKDNTWRFCVDYRALNGITTKNKFPIPLIEDLFSELANAKVFTKLDLRAGYHQVRMKKGDEYKTAFRTHQGLYEFNVMPFGLTNAPATFQALMNLVFKPLIRKTVLVFFDDILVYSPSLSQHWEHLREVLDIMKKNQLLAKLSKCSFAKKEVEYLGHIISENGLQTDPGKLVAVSAWPKPATIKELRGFLGLTGYYRRFIKSYGTLSRPLTDMLRKNAFQWSDESEKAFEQLKVALCSAPVLALPDFNETFVVEADACYKGMGAVLMQEGKPIAYYSKGFGPKHLGLSIYEKEYLSIINAIDKWRS
ncbi:PREDICTED: uncharacterized protein LOC109166012 [Ipomoea nil]|uniref:uncharacterized protein LOC109166012 n=1 Tax=Ipomoea nil TaxID=35883 RepID=UPI00090192C8|nr:PREDICTED: uncharacterized protein LOC109166012 [Ipomoea nil]